ncbi:DUF3048 domain-containing protein [Peribacillus simplex]|uniref:DUF3048 domain-containing protein n=1 Tax=Peribacillus simplex TaxID=1478 RepID=A0AAW7IKI7_9BACI|nr:DUF3048 domain-containing protein [Peribacillus simplex]MDM5296580.1 DUF3048 domain-containing protein [Peribacillus simplex]MDM5455626.1 DUF3048 domain-containing protein [Peribacillus simplex]
MNLKRVLFIVIAILLLAGCSAKEDPASDDSKRKDPDVIKNRNVKNEPSNEFPLTGIATDEGSEQRAVAVMINNHPKARPQSGLSEADMVYEMLAEGDITRFLAIFQSETPSQIGPIRSARDYYIELAKGLDCIYVCHGNSPEAKTMLDKGYIDNLNGLYYDGTLFHRSADRKAPHNSYISFEDIQKGVKEKGYEMNGAPEPYTFLSKEEAAGLQGEQALKTEISYGSDEYDVKYEYDATEEKYKRYSNGEQTVEYKSNKPILLDNILIIEATHQVIDDKGRRKIDLKSGGKGYLLQKGKANEVEWVNKDGRIIPVKNDNEVGLIPGKTWINIIPNEPGLVGDVSF